MTVLLTATGLIVAFKATAGVVAVVLLGVAVKRGPRGVG